MAEFAGSEPTGELVREARSERATASVDASGSISDVRLDQAVDFREAAVRITSNQARMRMNEGEAEFIGGPVQVVGERGELKAPRVLFQREQNRVHAQEGVRAVLSSPQGSAIPGPLLNSGEGPVYVDSEEAFWHRDEDLFVFRGSVRAWRGRDLLLAEEAEVNRAGDRLRASGGVKTVWHPQARQRTEADTLEVDAQRFDYDGANQRLLYKGKVKVDDGLYRMACDEAQIDLLKDGGMERLNCTGAARLEDPAQGRVVEGSRAVYDPGVEIVEVYGDPVIMKDREGSELKGRELVYRLQQGTVEFRSAKPEGSSAGESGSDETASEERP
jgi:lipopolysaccharide transport protein LptA